jgi:ABC-type glutathione transport system ATPase component
LTKRFLIPRDFATLPDILSTDEVTSMLDSTQNLKHWTMLATFYATADVGGVVHVSRTGVPK